MSLSSFDRLPLTCCRFAFCNLDDISWGTKEQGTQETDLGSVVQNHKSQVDIEIFVSSADDAYLTSLDNIKKNTPVKKPIAKPSEAQDQQKARDYYANVRTNVWTMLFRKTVALS